jgi:hypothetical protein
MIDQSVINRVNQNSAKRRKLRKENFMEKGINLSLTKSLAEFDTLLETAVEAVSSKKLTVARELDDSNLWKFQVGKYIQINEENDDDEETAIFWIGFGWEEKDKHESCIWLEFDAKTCPVKYWDKIDKLVGTSGKYYSEIDFEFVQVYMNAWIHFFLKKDYIDQFYDEKTDLNIQKEILTGFVNEVLGKIG